MVVQIKCQVPECVYAAIGDTEAIAIAMLTNHNSTHLNPSGSAHRRTNQPKPPQIARPEVKQDISAEDWYSFLEEWKRFKRITGLKEAEFSDQLFQCCERQLSRLLLKENPGIVEEGEKALIEAIQKMAVLQVAVSVRRTKLLATKQEPGQLFREFFANVRATASTCNYSVPCPHACCAANSSTVDYTSRVVKDILIAGIADDDIRRDVLGHPQLDDKCDKDVVTFVEEKEMAKNACHATSRTEVNAMSTYRKNSKDDTKHKLTLKGKCSKCGTEIALYVRYRSGKMNKDPFEKCLKCFRIERDNKLPKTLRDSETNALSFIESLSSFHRDRERADTDPL